MYLTYRGSKCKELIEWKEEIDKFTVAFGDFSTPLRLNYKHTDRKSPVYRTYNIMKHLDLNDLHRNSPPNNGRYILFKCTWNIYQERP